MKFLGLLALLLPLALGACVTVPPPTATPEEIASFKLTAVEVQGVDVINSWPVEERHFLASGKADADIAQRLPSESAKHFPVVQAYFQAELQRQFSTQFDRYVAPVIHGVRPVKAIVRLKQFDVPSTIRRVLVDQQAKLNFAVDLVDAKTNANLLSYPGVDRQKRLWGGLGAPIAEAIAGEADAGKELIESGVGEYASWLAAR
jgi:hypothetical protein